MPEKKTKNCLDCNKPISRRAKKCLSHSLKGTHRGLGVSKNRLEKHWKWNGGVSKNRHKGKEYILWRVAVFTRDNFTCQNCHAKGYLEAHHIKSWALYPELRYAIDNGITLCKLCHQKTDTYPKQFIERRVD